MPCVLCIASKEELDTICHNQSRCQCVAPLMIRYKCGFVPLGIFPALIASLISNKSFSLVERGMTNNKVKFYYQPLKTLVSFLCYPRFYAIFISQFFCLRARGSQGVCSYKTASCGGCIRTGWFSHELR